MTENQHEHIDPNPARPSQAASITVSSWAASLMRRRP